MTARDLLRESSETTDFMAMIRQWMQDGVPNPGWRDLFLDWGMEGQAAGLLYAAEGIIGEGHKRFMPESRFGSVDFNQRQGLIASRQTRWHMNLLPAAVWNRTNRPGDPNGPSSTLPSIEESLCDYLDAWAEVGLTMEQLLACQALADVPGQVKTLGGYAGTGKTTVLAHLVRAYPRYRPCAFTGKAVNVMNLKGIHAQTIHSTIYRPETDDRGRVTWLKKSRKDLGCDGFIIDEASMVSLELFRDLQAYDLPIIAIGDHGQLPPVGEDAKLMESPHVTLETIHRNAGPIAKFAEFLRKGGQPWEWHKEINDEAGREVRVVRGVSDREVFESDQMICALNRTRKRLNERALRIREHNEIARPPGRLPKAGDRVICLRNGAGVYNGMQGLVQSFGSANSRLFDVDDGWDIHTPGVAVGPGAASAADVLVFNPHGTALSIPIHTDREAWLSDKLKPRTGRVIPGRNVPFDYGYCITAHKAQGDEWRNVIVFEERCDKLWAFSRWAYTAASRAREGLIWVM